MSIAMLPHAWGREREKVGEGGFGFGVLGH
jgi:hypothetical protein